MGVSTANTFKKINAAVHSKFSRGCCNCEIIPLAVQDKTKQAAKVDKTNVDHMFTIHPQIFWGKVVQGRVKQEKRGEKRKLSLPEPQNPKKPKLR